MTAAKTAKGLMDAAQKAEAKNIIESAHGISILELAYAVKERCYELWTNEPKAAQRAARALELLESRTDDNEVNAVKDWIVGIAEITDGNLEAALASLSRANEGFKKLGKLNEAAQTRVAQLIPLGLLGDYERAFAAGNEALKVFEQDSDHLAAGKIELNLAIIASRQGRHTESLQFCESASERFKSAGETTWLLMAENDLAISLAELNRFDEAEERYRSALEIARREEQHLTEAELLASLGNLQTFRTRYGEALESLELSRQKYNDLKMPNRSVTADLEIAEIYQMLNLTEEASEIYSRVTEALKEFGMRGEEARARLNSGRLAFTLGDFSHAESELDRAAELFAEEQNESGSGHARLLKAQLLRGQARNKEALAELELSSQTVQRKEHPRLAIESDYLRGDLYRELGDLENSSRLLTEVLSAASEAEQQNVVTNSLVSLAKLAITSNDIPEAKTYLERAIESVEKLREPIPAEVFRMSFLADKLSPYELSAKLALESGDDEKAFVLLERARSRTLFERLYRPEEGQTDDEKEYKRLREKLNWYYSSLGNSEEGEARLQNEISLLEKKLVSVSLADSSVKRKNALISAGTDWKNFVGDLQPRMDESEILIEYYQMDGKISAFLVDKKQIRHYDLGISEVEVFELIEGLRFQFESMRFGDAGGFEEQLKERADSYLSELYDCLIEPFEDEIENKLLVVVPVGPLFPVPFNALLDGNEYLIEKNEVLISPSAAIWSILQTRGSAMSWPWLVFSYADDNAPQIAREAEMIARNTANATIFQGQDSKISMYFENAKRASVIHLACHGEFRADNPMFSNLRLADGFLTVDDISKTTLKADLVTLSACETGLNRIFAGEEILGLARGFLGAGAANVMMSLWTVDDESTLELMEGFYADYRNSGQGTRALRAAQRQLISKERHPYYWSPFVIIGK